MRMKLSVMSVAALVAISGFPGGIIASVDGSGASRLPASAPDDPGVTMQQTDTTVPNQTASITFANVTTNGTAIVIERVVLPAGGYIVIHNQSGAVIGTSDRFIEPGVHQNVTVPLGSPSQNRAQVARSIGKNQTLVAVAHRETDDDLRQVFEFFQSNGSVDYPYFVNGEIVSDKAFVVVAKGAIERAGEPMATPAETPIEPMTETKNRTSYSNPRMSS